MSSQIGVQISTLTLGRRRIIVDKLLLYTAKTGTPVQLNQNYRNGFPQRVGEVVSVLGDGVLHGIPHYFANRNPAPWDTR